MSGLPCEACQEPMVVLNSHDPVLDNANRVVFPRSRTCVTEGCEFYLVRRVTYEVVAPLDDDISIVSNTHTKLVRGKGRAMPARAELFPNDPLNPTPGGSP